MGISSVAGNAHVNTPRFVYKPTFYELIVRSVFYKILKLLYALLIPWVWYLLSPWCISINVNAVICSGKFLETCNYFIKVVKLQYEIKKKTLRFKNERVAQYMNKLKLRKQRNNRNVLNGN